MTKDEKPLAPARQSFNWVEIFTIPIASSIMEAQPLVLGLYFLSPLMMGSSTTPFPAGEREVTLLLLGFNWLSLFVQYLVNHRGISTDRARIIQIAGLFIGVAAVILPYVLIIPNTFFFLAIMAALALWCWKRGTDKVRVELREEQLINVFRIGFIFFIIILVLSILYTNAGFVIPSAVLAQTLPLFFLSGLLALSFNRLDLLRKENAQHGGGRDSTRSWVVMLTILWFIVVAAAFAVQIFGFSILLNIMNVIWFILGYILYVILFVIFSILSFLGSLLFPKTTKGVLPKINIGSLAGNNSALTGHNAGHTGGIDLLLIFGRLALLIAAVIVVIVVIRFTLKRMERTNSALDEEEEREGLSIGEVLQERREERRKRRQRKDIFTLEALDPGSARARYRELLLQMRDDGGGLNWRPSETPIEYQKRLLNAIKFRPAPVSGGSDLNAPPDTEIIEELTRAYTSERYGARKTDETRRSFLGTWVPRLTQRLYRPKPSRVSE